MEIYTPSIIISVANNVEDMAKKQMNITIMKICVKAPAKCLAPTAAARVIDASGALGTWHSHLKEYRKAHSRGGIEHVKA